MAKLTCKFFANIENTVSFIVSINQDAAGNSRDSAKSCSFHSISRPYTQFYSDPFVAAKLSDLVTCDRLTFR